MKIRVCIVAKSILEPGVGLGVTPGARGDDALGGGFGEPPLSDLLQASMLTSKTMAASADRKLVRI